MGNGGMGNWIWEVELGIEVRSTNLLPIPNSLFPILSGLYRTMWAESESGNAGSQDARRPLGNPDDPESDSSGVTRDGVSRI